MITLCCLGRYLLVVTIVLRHVMVLVPLHLTHISYLQYNLKL